MDRETNGASQTLEAGVASAVQRAQSTLRVQYQACEESVRQSPGSSVLMAAVAGYLFRNLPVSALIGGIIRLVLALVRPALFLYVAAKGYEFVQRGASSGKESNSGSGEIASPRRAQRAARN